MHTTTEDEGEYLRRGLRLALTGLVALFTAVAVLTTTAAPAQAADSYEHRHKLATPGADLNLRSTFTQNYSSANDTCLVYAQQTIEVINGSGHTQSEASLEGSVKRALDRTELDLSGAGYGSGFKPDIRVKDSSRQPGGYVSLALPSNNGSCPDAIQNDYHRRLGAIGTLGKTVGAIFAGIAVTVVFTAGVTVLAADFFPSAYANPNFVPAVACAGNALGIFTTQSILGNDGATKGASAAIACVSSAFGEKLQALAKWFADKRMATLVDAVDGGGAEVVPDYTVAQMQAFLTSFGD